MQPKQKVSKATICRFGVLLLSIQVGIGAVGQDVSGSDQGIVEYSSRSLLRSKPLELSRDDGVEYRLLLVPELDTQRHVIVLDLVLRRAGESANSLNLLEPKENWHGSQPFSFAALDFVHGAESSPRVNTRVIDVPSLGIQLEIKVAGVDVVPISSESSSKLPYQFSDLKLQIASRPLSQTRPKT